MKMELSTVLCVDINDKPGRVGPQSYVFMQDYTLYCKHVCARKGLY